MSRRAAPALPPILMRLLLAAPALAGALAAAAEPPATSSSPQQSSPPPSSPASAAAPASAPAPASADAAPATPKVEVRGAAASYDARRNDTASKIVVTQEEILRNGDTTVAEVLKRLPGVTIGGVQGRGGDIRMRGLGAGYTQILLNGEPAPAGFSLDSLAPDMIERIEILRAATAEFSTQAIAGGINIILKKSIQSGQREVKVGAQRDNGQLGANLNVQLSERKGALSYALGGGATYAHFTRPSRIVSSGGLEGAAPTLARTASEASSGQFSALNLSPRVNWTLGPGDVLTWQGFLNLNRFHADNGESVATTLGMPPPYSGTHVHIESHFDMLRSDVTWTRKLAQGAKLDLKAGLNYNERATTAPSEQYYQDGTLALNRLITSSASEHGASASGKYSTPIIEHHALAMGWDGAYALRSEERIERERSAVGAPAFDLDQLFDANVARLALFGQDEWTVSPQWSVYGGVRWEGIRTRSAGNNYQAVENRSSVWSPLFQTLWKLPDSKNDQLRLALTRTYKAPSVNSLIPRRFASNNNSATAPDQQGNPALRPELAWGLDLAYEHYIDGGGLMTASTYVRRIDDITHTLVSLQNGLWVAMPVNDGRANTHGIELEAKMPLRALFKTAPALELRANLTRNWSTLSAVPGPNNRLDAQTPLSGTIGADYKSERSALALGGSYSYQGGGPVRLSLQQSQYTVPKRALDLYALYKFDRKNQLRISLANVLHQDNVQETHYAQGASYLADSTITPTTAVLRALLEMKF
ncbi:MAG: TonB-dependent receptor [Pseudomonadota bacterium]